MNKSSLLQPVFLTFLVIFITLVSGCGSSSQRDSSNYSLHFQAHPQVDNSAPLKIRVLLLKSDAEFMSSDFYSLQNNAQAVLGVNLLTSDEFFLMSGKLSKKLTGRSTPEARYIGVIAEYQSLDGKEWRISLPLSNPSKTSSWMFWNFSADELQTDLYLDVNGIRNLAQ